MSLPWLLILSLLTGFFAGLLYFIGLMFTIRRLTSLRRPMLFFMASFVVRSVLILAAFFLVSQGRWQGLVACILGFLIARRTATTKWRPEAADSGERGG